MGVNNDSILIFGVNILLNCILNRHVIRIERKQKVVCHTQHNSIRNYCSVMIVVDLKEKTDGRSLDLQSRMRSCVKSSS